MLVLYLFPHVQVAVILYSRLNIFVRVVSSGIPCCDCTTVFFQRVVGLPLESLGLPRPSREKPAESVSLLSLWYNESYRMADVS